LPLSGNSETSIKYFIVIERADGKFWTQSNQFYFKLIPSKGPIFR